MRNGMGLSRMDSSPTAKEGVAIKVENHHPLAKQAPRVPVAGNARGEVGRIHRHTWRLWLRQKKLPAVRLGRRLLVAEVDYERFVAANRG